MDDLELKQKLIEEYSNAIIKSKASVFIGSGMSLKSKYSGWSEFLNDKASSLKLNIDKEKFDLINIAQYYVNKEGRESINESIKTFFINNDEHQPTINHDILINLDIKNYWTTNYDQMIEKCFIKNHKDYQSIENDEELPTISTNTQNIVIKMHGDVDNPNNCIITRTDYEKYSDEHELLLSKFKADMCQRTFLFLGYSFSDPDIFHILARIRLKSNDNVKTHYCIMIKEKRKDYDSDKDYEYALIKQQLRKKDFEQYGIYVLIVEDPKEITDILNDIKNQANKKNVFISGALATDNETVTSFTKELAKELIKNDYHINNGFGMKLGSYVVKGAIEGCNENKMHHFEDIVKIYPFPHDIEESDSKMECYEALRHKMITTTRFSIIICGEKIDKKTGNKIISNGCIEENEISKSQNNIIIPVAFTGGAAKVIWDEMDKDNTYSYSKDLFNGLLDKDKALNAIRKILNLE